MAAPSDVGDALEVIENIFQKSFILSTVISRKKGKQKGLMLCSANAPMRIKFTSDQNKVKYTILLSIGSTTNTYLVKIL